MTEPETIKFFTDDGEILVEEGSLSPIVQWQDEKAPVWVSILVLAISAALSLGTLGLFVWSVIRID